MRQDIPTISTVTDMNADNKSEKLEVLRSLLAEPKFFEEDFYPGAPNEDIRKDCEQRVNGFIKELIQMSDSNTPMLQISSFASHFIDSFREEDTEEFEKADEYVGLAMSALGVDDWGQHL